MTVPDALADRRVPTIAAPLDRDGRRRLTWEIWIVLAVSVGQSALYSVLSLVRRLLAPVPLGSQQTQVNPSRDAQALWDVVYQLLSIFFALSLIPFSALLWLLARSERKRTETADPKPVFNHG